MGKGGGGIVDTPDLCRESAFGLRACSSGLGRSRLAEMHACFEVSSEKGSVGLQ